MPTFTLRIFLEQKNNSPPVTPCATSAITMEAWAMAMEASVAWALVVAGDVQASLDWAVAGAGEATYMAASAHCVMEDMGSLASTKLLCQ